MSQYGFGVLWCKKKNYIDCTFGGTPQQYFSRFIEDLLFFFNNETLFVAFSFKGQPMGAVSVFTSEELPSPTLSEILSLPFPRSCSFRDVVASLLVL